MSKGARIFLLVLLIGTSVLLVFAVTSIYYTNSFMEKMAGSDIEDFLSVDLSGFELIDQESIDLFSSMSKNEQLQMIADEFVGGGPSKDGIPPIDTPLYISVNEVGDFLDDDDRVFVLESGDEIRIYPQKILVWHEIVNDTIAGESVVVTYCPLAGTVIGFPYDQSGITSSFGTSGKLVNSNLVMYDRETDSLFPQILKTAVAGSRFGEELTMFPLDWSTWGRARRAFPDAQVLSEDTGFLRTYEIDPYGSYKEEGTYYNSGNPFFLTMNSDDRLPAKEVVVGIYGPQGSKAAVVKNSITSKNGKTIELDGQLFTAQFDEDLETVKIYKGEDNSSELADYVDAMWFAWVAYFPDTDLYQ